MFVFRLTAEALGAIPEPVRDALQLHIGDEVAYAIEDGRVVLTKAGASPVDDPFRSFDEWDSEADRKAYADL